MIGTRESWLASRPKLEGVSPRTDLPTPQCCDAAFMAIMKETRRSGHALQSAKRGDGLMEITERVALALGIPAITGLPTKNQRRI
jgi:hypothetical protein